MFLCLSASVYVELFMSVTVSRCLNSRHDKVLQMAPVDVFFSDGGCIFKTVKIIARETSVHGLRLRAGRHGGCSLGRRGSERLAHRGMRDLTSQRTVLRAPIRVKMSGVETVGASHAQVFSSTWSKKPRAPETMCTTPSRNADVCDVTLLEGDDHCDGSAIDQCRTIAQTRRTE